MNAPFIHLLWLSLCTVYNLVTFFRLKPCRSLLSFSLSLSLCSQCYFPAFSWVLSLWLVVGESCLSTGKSCHVSVRAIKPPYLRNGATYDQGCCWSLIGNRIRAFDWYQNQRPWMTLKWKTAIMRSVTLHTSFEAHHKNLNEDRPILSATKM